MELSKSNTRQELLDNTIQYFNLTNRAVDYRGFCFYVHPSNKDQRCAIGRELSEKKALKLLNTEMPVPNKKVFNILPDRLKNMGVSFLKEIQILHDNELYWTATGLSGRGKREVKRICRVYNLQFNPKPKN